MSRDADIVELLLSILVDHVEKCDLWDDHYAAALGGRISLSEETEQNQFLRTNYTSPLIARCEEEGFNYFDLDRIIPIPFKTSKKERAALLLDLWHYAGDEYGVPPF